MTELDPHYTDPDMAELYDVDSGWSVDRDYYRGLPDGQAQCILDVGCGTGLIAAAYAQDGHHVTGVDPAQAMLDVARDRPQGDDVNWITGTAQSFDLPDRFDLIIMTGHAFQTLLKDADIVDSFCNIARHLAPKGRFVFESRNPVIDWATLWTHAYDLDTGAGKVPLSRHVNDQAGEFITFTNRFHFAEGAKDSVSTLRFAPLDKLDTLAVQAGLRRAHLAGDWDDSPFQPATSKEMILHLVPA